MFIEAEYSDNDSDPRDDYVDGVTEMASLGHLSFEVLNFLRCNSVSRKWVILHDILLICPCICSIFALQSVIVCPDINHPYFLWIVLSVKIFLPCNVQ